MSETALVRQILQYLGWRRDVFCWRQNTGGANYTYTNKAGKTKTQYVKYGFAGMADIIGMYNGRFLAIEAKFGKGEQKPPQQAFQHTVERFGGMYVIARSLQDVQDALGCEE